MKKFILITFGFLGWAFYEMSGGADFEPASERMARLNPAPESVTPVAATPAPTVVADAPPAFVDTDPPLNDTVTRVSLNLTSLEDILAEPQATHTANVPAAQDDTSVPQNINQTAGSSSSSADTPAIIPSLLSPAQNLQVAALNSSGDVRTVSANRVNVRGGPGTDFGVVTKLERGDAVEVLQDNGDGWVKMRSLDGGPEGWMADFLLAGG